MTRTFTIGFTETTAEHFFERLKTAGAKRLVDVRLNNKSQLAGFAKKDDLRFFLREIGRIEYVHLPILAPSQGMLDEYKKRRGAWADYERRFVELIASRRIEQAVDRGTLDGACLLCSEREPTRCHRRLVVEYLRDKWGDVQIVHL